MTAPDEAVHAAMVNQTQRNIDGEKVVFMIEPRE
jgi:hypothetical protein